MSLVYLFALFLLGVYSYSQIDLNLTLFQNPLFLNFQRVMIQIGYFNRPLSGNLFAIIVVILFALYLIILHRSSQEKIFPKQLTLVIITIVVLGLVSYPAFSHDIFNYLFDARILTHYGQNPYLFKPLDFPGDPWLRFMHWVHRTYPYGPAWIVLTTIPSFFGLGKFTVTLLSFKFLFILSYLANIFLIAKISKKIQHQFQHQSVIFFALNPMVVVESLISPHLDSIMLTFLLLSLYFYIKDKKLFSIISMILSGGIKFLTWLLVPLCLFKFKKISTLIWLSLVVLSIGLVPVIIQREFYPWYFLPLFGLGSLLLENHSLKTILIALAFGLTLSYLPFLLVGDYPPQVQLEKNLLIFLPVIITTIWIYGRKIFKFT